LVYDPFFALTPAGGGPDQLAWAAGLLESVQALAMSLGIAVVGTVLFDRIGTGDADGFVGAADDALLVAVALLGAAWAAVFWLPKHARGEH
jgi:hypothetical protein